MNIGGREVSKKTVWVIVIVVAVFLLLIIRSISSSNKKQKAIEEAQEAARLAALQNQTETQVGEEVVLSIHDQLQLSYQNMWGIPPEGFEWDATGALVALGNDEMSYEDVVRTYIQSLSKLDFATAQRCASASSVINTYDSYYSEASSAVANYYRTFLRKQYKTSLTTLELDKIKDVAVFANGKYTVTVTVNVLDLTDKDFWEKDREKLFETMRVYDSTESDSTKKQQYLYDYISSAYENGDIGKRSVDLELVVSKRNGGGYLISDDNELNFAIKYENGVDVAQYIFNLYSDWLRDEQLKEIAD